MSRLKRFFNDVILEGTALKDINVKKASQSSFTPSTIHANAPFGEADVSRVAVATTCIKTLAETLGRIPPELYRNDPKKGKVKNKESHLYSLVHSQPNP
jgi:phage portal protein BeeE